MAEPSPAIFLVLERESWNDHFSLAKRFMLKLIGPLSVLLSSFAMLSAAVFAGKEVEMLTDAWFFEATHTVQVPFFTPGVFREGGCPPGANAPIFIPTPLPRTLFLV